MKPPSRLRQPRLLRRDWIGDAILTMLAGAMLLAGVTRPRRASVLLGVLVAASGVAAFGVAQDAAASIGYLDPGVGMYITTLAAVLLVPIGLAATLVAWLLVRTERAPEGSPAPTAPPAPESAPPS